MKEDSTPTFHALTIKYNGVTNRIVTELRLSEAFDPTQPPEEPVLQCKTGALWDTGATKSVITGATANSLGLVPSGSTRVVHAGGSSEQNTYLVNFYLPNNVLVAGVQVSECVDIAGSFGAIIGMDIIGMGDLAITNVDQQTCMTFRIPSVQCVDYVTEANEVNLANAKLDEPCPCGNKDENGNPVKFKDCHGKDG